MNKLEKVGCVLVIVAIISLGVVFGPGIIETAQDNFEEKNFKCVYDTPSPELLDIFVREGGVTFFGLSVAMDYFKIGVETTYTYTSSERAEYFIYVEENVPEGGMFTTVTSDTYSFNYQSLMDNDGYANLTLVDTYLLITVIPWE